MKPKDISITIVFLGIFFMIILYAGFPGYFARKFYFNEFFAFIGFLLFLAKPVIYKKSDKLYNYLLFLITYGITHLFISYFFKDNLYAYLRTSVIVYSMFSFFIGYWLYVYKNIFIKIMNIIINKLVVVAVFIPSFIHRVSGLILFPFIYFKKYKLYLLTIIILDVLVFLNYSGETALIVGLFFLLLIFVKKYKTFKLLMMLGFLTFSLFFISVSKNLSLIHTGVVGDGSLKDELEKLVANLGIKDKVIFAGYCNHPASFIRDFNIGVICSSTESFPNVVLEYMGLGKPVVAPSIGGIPEIVQNKLTGILFSPGNIKDFADALYFLLKNPDIAKQMGKVGKEKVEKHFSIDIMAKKYEEIYFKFSN
jgi:glycosyltransferase involved in cell wall biosynthesis